MELTKAQQEAIDHIDGHLQIIACAGSGKTEVISRRIANILQKRPDVKPENIVAFTFTEKAAESLKNRVESTLGEQVPGMFINTIHSFCKYLLSNYTEEFAEFKVLDTVKNHLFITRYADGCGMATLELQPCPLNSDLYLQCIDKLIDNYDNRDNWTDVQRSVLEQYISCLYDHKYIDFSLLLFEALRQIQENPNVQSYLQTIQYLVVDEYQDVNDLQEKLIRAIAEYGANVCVVGDDDQTIYQFRGSNADNMISFPERYAGTTQVHMEENFRCQEGIVDVAANVICHNAHRVRKQMGSGAQKVNSIIQAKGYPDIETEFSAIAEKITRLRDDGVPYHEMAVLVRKGKFVPIIAAALAAKGIPYAADSAEAFFEGEYFNRFVETLRTLDSIDKAALYEQWKDLVDGPKFNMGFKYLRSCARGGALRLRTILEEYCGKVDFLNENASDYSTRKEDLDGFCKILDDFDEIYGDYQLSARITKLLKFLGLQARQEYRYRNFRESAADINAVQLMTVHKAKGLEFHTVFLPRLNRREFPVSAMGGREYYHVLGGIFAENKEKYKSDVEDERKLFYVAVTRAKQNLYLSYTLENQPVSEFVSNAAESAALQMNREDLRYQPVKKSTAAVKVATSDVWYQQRKEEQAKKQAEREEYWELVNYARNALFDYYGSGNRYCPGIILEYQDICKQGSDAILSKAQEMGMI
jgi:DNA helicase-2/ATP-dependent DNA helicase PcrA